MAQHVVDHFEAGNVHENDGQPLAALGPHVPQGAVQLIHEVTSVGQARESIVEAGVVEGFLQLQTLLHLRGQLFVHYMQPVP